MTIHYLDSDPRALGALATLRDPRSRYTGYFVRGEGDGEFLSLASCVAHADGELSDSGICWGLDHVATTLGIPLFSSRARDLLEGCPDLAFHPCELRFGRDAELFHLVRTTRYLPLIDEAASSFRELAIGGRILSKPVFLKDLPEFMLARDIHHRERLVASDRFRAWAEEAGLRICFARV